MRLTIGGRRPVAVDLVSARNLAAFGVACLALAWAIINTCALGVVFGDARSYWLEWHGPLYEPNTPLWLPHFVYAPPAALAFWPLAQLPEVAFVVAWAALGTVAYVWLLAPLPLPSRIPATLAGILFALNGNIEWLLALVVLFGRRWPPLWLVALFTKISPFLGFGWFVIRGQWRAVVTTLALGIALVLASELLLPGSWRTWISMVVLFRGQTDTVQNLLMPLGPFPLRFGFASALLVWAAWRDRPAALPVVVLLCQPDMQPWALGFLAAVPRLLIWQTGNDTHGRLVPGDAAEGHPGLPASV